MNRPAGQLISKRVVIGYPEQRLAYLSEQIAARHAQYCAILEPGTAMLIGLVTFSDLAASATTVNRIFADLMRKPPRHQVFRNDPATKVRSIYEVERHFEEVTVLNEDGTFYGLITLESFCTWVIQRSGKKERVE
ncbi:MAG TPA: hypothetical protein VFT72_17990 [Opitutaceae bacterium]|nr:hypothetical protein [Opitutaceae bacterium]